MMYGFGRKKRKRITKEIWLAPQLNERFHVLEPAQTEDSLGGFDQKYTLLTTIWGGITPVSHNSYRRWVSTEDLEKISHEFICRYSAVSTLHTEFSTAFSAAFDTISDLNPIKDDMFLLMERGSTAKGRMFRIRRAMNNLENDEYLSVLIEEMEELGTGANYDSDYVDLS